MPLYNLVRFKYRRYRKIVEILELKPDEKVLDVGCGDGLSFEVFNKVNPIVGVDIRPVKYKAKNFQFIQADASNLPFRDNEFDVAVSIGVFEHIRPMSKLVKASMEIARVSRRFLVVVPSIATLVEPHFQRIRWQLKDPNSKRRILTKRDVGWYKQNPEGRYEYLVYMSDETWLMLDGFKGASTLRYKYIPFLVENLFIYKK